MEEGRLQKGAGNEYVAYSMLIWHNSCLNIGTGTLDKTNTTREDCNLKHRTLQLFQLFLLVFAFYLPLQDSGNQHWLVSLACLVTVFMVEKLKTTFTEASHKENEQSGDMSKKDETRTTLQALDWLLKSKNVLLLTDAIQCLLQDLGLVVSPCPDHPAIDRLVRIPGVEVTWGLKILNDVTALKENWDKWDELASFDLGKGGKRRLLIVASNGIKGKGDLRQRYRNYSVNVQKLLSARHVVAMTTLTLGKIYLLCKKKKADIKTIFDPIQHYPGGVFQLERFAK